MPWHVGLDEAGYGPNLGPFVMSSCAFHTQHSEPDLWSFLNTAFCRPLEEGRGRIVVGDSKQVFSQSAGIAELERTVQACLPSSVNPSTLSDLLANLCPDHAEDLGTEPWFRGTRPLPAKACPIEIKQCRDRISATATQTQVQWGSTHACIVGTRRFNELTLRHGSKSAVLSDSLTELLRRNFALVQEDDVLIKADKHGGRNRYAAMLQDALPEGMVRPIEETALCSAYAVEGLPHRMRIVFEPRADSAHFGVSLASMVSKYLRELLMEEFNAFWADHVPNLKPTAGYPTDAKRFLTVIEPTLARLCIDRESIWRCR